MNAGRTIRGLALAAVAVPLAAPALATQGTFPHGYGVKAEGMGGGASANDFAISHTANSDFRSNGRELQYE